MKILALLLVIVLITAAGMSAVAARSARVLTGSMKVYEKASTSSKVLGTLKKGTKLSLTSVGPDWVRITCKGRSGYARWSQVRLTNRIGVYAKQSASVYKTASSSGKRIATVSAGTKLYVAGQNGGWYLVENSRATVRGYVKKTLVGTKKPSSGKSTKTNEPSAGYGFPSDLKSNVNAYDASLSNLAKIEYVIYIAQKQMGKPYEVSASPPESFDCARFVRYCWNKAKITLKASAKGQGYDERYEKIGSTSDLNRGDVVFFNTNTSDEDRCDHSGLYLGRGYFIHASSAAGKVIVSKLNTGYYKNAFSWGRRILK